MPDLRLGVDLGAVSDKSLYNVLVTRQRRYVQRSVTFLSHTRTHIHRDCY